MPVNDAPGLLLTISPPVHPGDVIAYLVYLAYLTNWLSDGLNGGSERTFSKSSRQSVVGLLRQRHERRVMGERKGT
jgi:hypothetical protein